MGRLSFRATTLLTDMYKRFEAGEASCEYRAEDSRSIRELKEAWLVETNGAAAGKPGVVTAVTPYGKEKAREYMRSRRY